MKNLFNISLVLFAAFILFSCRSNDDIPEDIHEHEEIEKLVVTLTNKNDATDVQKINYIGGKADAHIHLHAGDSYIVGLDFQVKHDDHYHSVNDEIITEKEEHFITYAFADSNIQVKRTPDDVTRSSGKRIGMRTEWKVVSVADTGKVNIKLVHAPNSVEDNYPSADNQLGKTVGGESDIDATFAMHGAH
ncbi:hypothetical protein [Chryseobacterium sp. T1]